MASVSKSSTLDCGLPARPPTASTALWTHLMRTSTTSEAPNTLQDISIVAPPMAPLDKNVTSMRVLLHDTQANFEKFSNHVGRLLESIQETKNDLKTMHAVFERDRETLTSDIVDLINRSQREIQRSIGTPVQSDTIGGLFKDVNHRLEGLDQRLEALNAFNQTHSQALQTQIQTAQLVLDKQGSIISAVAPLLPLLQLLPPLIDTAKTVITEKLEEASFSRRNLSEVSSAAVLPKDRTTGKRKRSLDEGFASSPLSDCSPTNQKRSRIIHMSENASSDDGHTQIAMRPSAVHIPSSTTLTPKRAAILSCPPESRSSARNSRTEDKRLNVQSLATPRRPLGDVTVSMINVPGIELGSGSGSPGSRVLLSGASMKILSRCVAPCTNTDAHTSNTTALQEAGHSTPIFLGITPTAARPPRMLRMHTAITANSRASSVHTVSEGQANTTFFEAGANRVPNASPTVATNLESGGRQRFTQRTIAHTRENSAVSRKSVRESVPVIGRLTRSSTRPPTPLAQVTVPQQAVVKEDSSSPLMAKSKGKNVPLAVALGRMRERRSPWKEGRRFIPLMDSDEEEDS